MILDGIGAPVVPNVGLLIDQTERIAALGVRYAIPKSSRLPSLLLPAVF